MGALDDFDPDAVVTDIDLGSGPSGLDLVVAMDKRAPHLSFVVLSNYSITPDYRHAALGRAAYLRKQELVDTALLLDALEAVLRDRQPRETAIVSAGRLAGLTRSQVQVLRMIAEGSSNEEIARRRGASTKSVEHMIGRIFHALELTQDPSINMRVAATRVYMAEAGVLERER
jgi:DNA-binding NarL/FixJ family response regulator